MEDKTLHKELPANERDDIIDALAERIGNQNDRLVRLQRLQLQKKQQVRDLVEGMRARTVAMKSIAGELQGLNYAMDLLTGNLIFLGGPIDAVGDIEVVPVPAGEAEPETAAARPAHRAYTPEGRKEMLREAMAWWPESEGFARSRIATDTGLGTHLDEAIEEGIVGGWIEQNGNLYRWCEPTAAEKAGEEQPVPAAAPANDAEQPPAPPTIDLVYQTVVRLGRAPASVIAEELPPGLPVGTYLGHLSRRGAIRSEGGQWFATSPTPAGETPHEHAG